ncbi:hypothetical protein Desaci_4538 [Desulfosporosinus acidiphilus SJ4]|uniref:Uncharacterized protein n=1 Tax=Desulfosporosinus acidiphilus (strain DSM 22704 / JCM 16185 / SJ4) TaxID=646529 RepID=I4DC54_DESAJ|nr:hypothetical protein Desaci_4538 [Desulfosporosinus acidiphilus SJ4]
MQKQKRSQLCKERKEIVQVSVNTLRKTAICSAFEFSNIMIHGSPILFSNLKYIQIITLHYNKF